MAVTTLSEYLHLTAYLEWANTIGMFGQQIKTVLEYDYRELTYKMHVVKCLTTVASQSYIGAASKGYSLSQWLSVEHNKLFRWVTRVKEFTQSTRTHDQYIKN